MTALVLTSTERVLVVLTLVAVAAGLVRDHRRNGSAALGTPPPPPTQPARDPDAITAVEIHNIERADACLVTDDGGRYWMVDGSWWCTHHNWDIHQRVADPRVVDALNARAHRGRTHRMPLAEQRRVARG